MSSDPNTSINIKPYRVFKCVNENRMMDRDGVWKDVATGTYHCGSCASVVEDVTNTQTAQSLMYWWWGLVKK